MPSNRTPNEGGFEPCGCTGAFAADRNGTGKSRTLALATVPGMICPPGLPVILATFTVQPESGRTAID